MSRNNEFPRCRPANPPAYSPLDHGLCPAGATPGCEVLSEEYPYHLREEKQIYADHGARKFWAFHQDRPRVQVFRLIRPGEFARPRILAAGDTLASPLLPGFALPIDDLYRDLPPA